MSLDISETTAPKSDQLNAEDLLGGPRTYTVESVSKGSAEQPINIGLVELPGRAYRPSKSMRRILLAGWGKDAAQYAGRRLTLYRDASVRFGGQEVGGIKISHMSHLDERLVVALTVTRGKRAPHTVDPLPHDAPASAPEPTEQQVAECSDLGQLREWWNSSGVERRAQITQRVHDIQERQPATGARPLTAKEQENE